MSSQPFTRQDYRALAFIAFAVAVCILIGCLTATPPAVARDIPTPTVSVTVLDTPLAR